MRMIVFFDLPTLTGEDRKNYRMFRKVLITNGFVMMQESVYCKLMTSPGMEKSMISLLTKNKPKSGLVQALVVTENQYSKMSFIVGEAKTDVISSTDKVVIL